MTIESERAQTAVLDPANWDSSFPGERYFDALRPMLVRFPGMAEKLHDQLGQGYEIASARLVLHWDRQEGPGPQRGRKGWGAEAAYKEDPGQWHAVARANNRPWSTEQPELAPTFNAYVNGLGYWEKGGARAAGADRLAASTQPVALHAQSPVAELDVTALLADSAWGATLGQRLRAVEERGFQVLKHELYDLKYLRANAGYDWIVSTGYMRIWVDEPKLVIRLRPSADADPGKLPPTTSITQVAKQLREEGGQGTPSIAYTKEIAERAARYPQRPAGMPDWQWRRVQDLHAMHTDPGDATLALGRGFNFAALFAGDKELYLNAIQQLMQLPPRHWQGHLTSDFALLPALYGHLLPEGAMDHLKLYWQAWLHPQMRDITPLRVGVPSYFRGYADGEGTMNFGHNAVMSVLLAGDLIDAPIPLADARKGLEHILSDGYGFGTGAHQELGDTYYQAITLAAFGALANHAADPRDKLISQIHRDRLVESLVSIYHPGLRRLTHPMGRGHYRYHHLLQEGPYHLLHTLSPDGTLIHTDQLSDKRVGPPRTWGSVHGLHILGDEGPPQRMALLSPWTQPHMAQPVAGVVDDKPFPWRVHARDFSPGTRHGGWIVNYLSDHYALASRDNANANYGVTSIIAQWRRTPEQTDHVEDTNTLLLGMGANHAFSRSTVSMGEFGLVHHDNKILAMKALPKASNLTRSAGNKPIHALHTTAMLLALGDTSEREVWINSQRASELSGQREGSGDGWKNQAKSGGAVIAASEGDVITLRDGVTYVGLIPVTANAMNRDRQVEIAFDHPTLLVHNFIYRDESTPLDVDQLYESPNPPTAGFVLEMGDASQYPSFEAFRKHMQQVALESSWNPDETHVDMTYTSGDDVLEMAYDPTRFPAKRRRVNGQWPYVGGPIEHENNYPQPTGPEQEFAGHAQAPVMRASNWSIQGAAPRLEKNGVAINSDPGTPSYLLAPPGAGIFVGYNPTPALQSWQMIGPDEIEVRANGKVGLLRVAVRPADATLWIDQHQAPAKGTPDTPHATGLHLFGFAAPPTVILNGQRIDRLEKATVDGRDAYFISFRP